VGIVALARKLVVALWKYLERGEVPEGATLVPWEKKLNGRLPAAPQRTLKRSGWNGAACHTWQQFGNSTGNVAPTRLQYEQSV
jgi:hypothetical protein